jgi:hypothetical protein
MKRSAVGLLLTIVVAGCGGPEPTPSQTHTLPLVTQPAAAADGLVACMAALLPGTLTVDARTGLGIQLDEGPLVPVRWPHGWMALDARPIVLTDADGGVIAHVGDRMAIGGGDGVGDIWEACPSDIKVVP